MTTVPLLGPADADHYRVKVGRYGDRWYADPLPADVTWPATDAVWPSVSTVKRADSTDWTYVGLKRAAKAISERPDALDGLNYPAIYERLKSWNKVGLDDAAARGTQVHTYLEHALRTGQHPTFDAAFDHPTGKDYLPAICDFLDTYQPELVAAELVCINRDLNDLGYGGTSDAIVRLHHPDVDDRPVIVDWKSRGADSDHGAHPGEAAQMGAYADAQYHIVDTPDGPRRIPLPVMAHGLIVSIRPVGVRVYPVDLDDAVAQWERLHTWWVAKRDERKPIRKPWPPRKPAAASPAPAPVVDLDDAIATAPTGDALRALWAANAHRWGDAHTELAKARMAVLGEH